MHIFHSKPSLQAAPRGQASGLHLQLSEQLLAAGEAAVLSLRARPP